MSLSAVGLQGKMTVLYRWYNESFLVISAIKSHACIHGPLPSPLPILKFGAEPVNIVDQYTYVGFTLKSCLSVAFATIASLYYEEKAAKAHMVAHGVLHIESMIGSLSPM